VLEGVGSDALAGDLQRLRPVELLINETQRDSELYLQLTGVKTLPAWQFETPSCRQRLLDHFSCKDLNGFGCEDLPLAVTAAGCLLGYVQDTQQGNVPHIVSLSKEDNSDYIQLDAASRKNLELEINMSGGQENTLISVIDKTTTAMGGRQLRRWLNQPLRDQEQIKQRLNCVELFQQEQIFEQIQIPLRQISDLERIITRIALRSARPRAFSNLLDSLGILPGLRNQLSQLSNIESAPLLQPILTPATAGFPTLTQTIKQRHYR